MPLNKDLEKYILENIPISTAMGVRVENAMAQKVVVSAPFSNNINHKKTVFGGSLHAVATLSCWGLLHVQLNEILKQNAQIVIASSNVDYTAPVTSDFKSECSLPEKIEWDRFIAIYKKKGKARVTLHAKVFQDGRLCVDYSGVFVALTDPNL